MFKNRSFHAVSGETMTEATLSLSYDKGIIVNVYFYKIDL